MVTAEIAVALPALVLVLTLGLGAVTAVTDQLRCVDAARTGARLLASAGDRPELETGRIAYRDPDDSWDFPPVRVDGTLRDGQRVHVGDTVLTTHLTPGHTRGHVSFLLDRAGGVLFAGDAAAGKKGQVGSAPRSAAENLDELDRSVIKLASHDFESAVFGHGQAVSGRAVERFRRFRLRRLRPSPFAPDPLLAASELMLPPLPRRR